MQDWVIRRDSSKEKLPTTTNGHPSQDDGIVYSATKYRETDGIKVNKAHSAAYAFLSCITAWLKCYYPVEFMASLMTIAEGKKTKDKKPKNILYMRECEEMGIRILPPDINCSAEGWSPRSYEVPIQSEDKTWIGEIRYGLFSIAGVSGESVHEIINNRPYQSVEELIQKTNGTKVNKTKVEALIKAGCFDSISNNRNLLLRNYYKSRREEYIMYPEKTTKKDILEFEREVFGMAISLRSRWEKIQEGANTQITGHVTMITPWVAKSSNKTHYYVTVQTQEEPIEVTVWGSLYEQHKQTLQIGNKVTIKGEKNRERLKANGFTLLEQAGATLKQYEVNFDTAYA